MMNKAFEKMTLSELKDKLDVVYGEFLSIIEELERRKSDVSVKIKTVDVGGRKVRMRKVDGPIEQVKVFPPINTREPITVKMSRGKRILASVLHFVGLEDMSKVVLGEY